MEYVWNMSGICMEYEWNMSGICMEYEWNTYGIYLEYVWDKYGICMENVRISQDGSQLVHLVCRLVCRFCALMGTRPLVGGTCPGR